MIQTQQNHIIPMDFSSMMALIQPNGGEFTPLQYDVVQESPNITKIHINIQACDPDTISVDIRESFIEITGDAILRIANTQELTLTRPVSTTIPLASGIQLKDIHSLLDGDTLTLTIPLI